MKENTTHDHNNTGPRTVSEIGTFGNGPETAKCPADVQENVTVTESETTTIDLAAIGAAVPSGTTVDVARTPKGLKIDRREETFILEREAYGYALTGVVGRDELPGRVPDWIQPVAARFGMGEVTLGR